MGKWGEGYRWGGGTLWGQVDGVVSEPYTGDVVWIVNIDWTGSGSNNEADYVRSIDINRGRKHYVNPDGSGFEKMQPGKAVIILDNSNGRYDPYNTSSPLYSYILPGRKIQILVYDVVTKTTYVRFTGHVTDIQPSSGIEEVTITAEDGMRWLADADYSSGVTYANTISDAIGLVLSFVNWPYLRNIQISEQPIQVFEPGNGSSLSVIEDLAEANLGVFFVDRYGVATFFPVSYDVPSSQTHTIDQSQILREIRISQPWETVRNKIRIMANRKGKRPASSVWTMAGIETFTAGESKTFNASFKSSDGLTVQKILANTLKDRTGVDVSSYFTVGKSEVTASDCVLTVKNNSSATAYLLSLKLTGNEIVSAPDLRTAEDDTSIAQYGPRSFVLDNPWEQDRVFSDVYAHMILDFLKNPHKDPAIQIQQRPSLQYPIDLYDKIVLTSSTLGISATYTVGGIEEQWYSDTGQNAITTLYLQSVLYDAAVIEPDPFEPGSLPDIPFDDMPYWFDSWIPENNWPIFDPTGGGFGLDKSTACLRTDAYATRSFPLQFTNKRLANGAAEAGIIESFAWYPCTLRAGNSMNKSQITINGEWWRQEDGWNYDTTNGWWHCDAIDSAGSVLCSGTLSNIDNYSRQVTFEPTASVEIAGFRIWIDESTGSYSLQDVISTGSLVVNTAPGATVTGLTIGDYYAIEGAGGPWEAYADSNWYLYRIYIKPGATWLYVGGFDSKVGYINGVEGGEKLKIDNNIDGLHGRCYFVAQGTTCGITTDVPPYVYNNLGTMGYKLSNVAGPSHRRMLINTASLRNVCASGIF